MIHGHRRRGTVNQLRNVMTDEPNRPKILAVDDEQAFLDAYTTWLSDDYDVRTATNGQTALETLDEAVDVVLLDRRMPGLSGQRVLETIRERGIDCRVAMVTAVEPDLDIIDMEFDDYLVKPVDETEVTELVATLVTRQSFDAQLQECFSLVTKKAALEAALDREALESTAEYRGLQERLAAVEADAETTLETLLDRDAVIGAYDDLQADATRAGRSP